MNRKIIDLWVGIFVAIGLAALLFLALKVGNLLSFNEDRKGYELEARFDNIGALKPRAQVKVAGVVVGRVESVRLDKKTYEAIVRLHLFPEYQFSRDTIATANTTLLITPFRMSCRQSTAAVICPQYAPLSMPIRRTPTR